MFSYTSYSICAEVSRLAFKFSAVIPLGPGALLFFCFSTALLISSMAGFAVLTFKSKAGVSELSATSDGGRSQEADLEGHAEKYSAHLEIWSFSFVILLPGASLMPLDGDTVSLKAFLLCRRGPTSYAVVQQSTSCARLSTNLHLLHLISLCILQWIALYWSCACFLAALFLLLLTSTLHLLFSGNFCSVLMKSIPYADEYWDQVLPLLFQSTLVFDEAMCLPRSDFNLLCGIVWGIRTFWWALPGRSWVLLGLVQVCCWMSYHLYSYW